MNIKTNGLVIAQQKIKENDRLITVLTRDFGVIKAFARGANNIKNSKCSSTQLFAYSDFEFFKTKDYILVDDAKSKEIFIKLRTDIKKVALAQYLCQLISEIFSFADNSEEMLRVILNAFYYISNEKIQFKQLKAVCELRLLSLNGYMPDLLCCKGCRCFEDDVIQFNLDSSSFLCSKCSNNNANNIKITRGVLTAMRNSVYAPLEKLFAFTLSDEGMNIFSDIAERYTIRKLDKILPTLEYYKIIDN